MQRQQQQLDQARQQQQMQRLQRQQEQEDAVRNTGSTPPLQIDHVSPPAPAHFTSADQSPASADPHSDAGASTAGAQQNEPLAQLHFHHLLHAGMAEALKTDTVDQQYALLEALSPLPTSSSLTPLQASITPVLLTPTPDQPGLTKAPPPPVQRILPFRLEPPRRRGTTRPWYSIPSGPGGHPIISPEPSAYQAHVVGTPSQSHAVKCEKYGEAVLV